jgi:thiamine pyrophosphate-dependent acetolactate synthase large subunit-like protein
MRVVTPGSKYEGPMTSDGRGEIRRDVPVAGPASNAVWGSDAIAALLRALDIPYVCLNPGASFRGLHDSLVNYLGNERPQMLLCLHEEHAVAIAHGWAKVTGRPLAAILHSNVGLMHGSMAIFDAWCDRVPVMVLGATGPLDAAKRRPWIDWIHTAQDQAALVRPFIKWDAQPASIPAAYEALLRAKQIAETAPHGPVYVCFDATLQETRLDAMPALPDVARYRAPVTGYPAPHLINEAARLLSAAKSPVLLMGRVSRSIEGWRDRIVLAESLQAQVLTDGKVGAAFPTDHPLHAAPPGHFLAPAAAATLKTADVVLSLDWLDLAGTLKQAWGNAPVTAKVIQVSVDQYSHTGWGMEHQGLPPTDVSLMCEPEPAVTALLAAMTPRAASKPVARPVAAKAAAPSETISIASLAAALKIATAGHDVCLIRLPLGWSGELWDFHHPLDYLGTDGGGGIGSGPGMTVGAALALKDSGRLPIALIGDGDFLMGATAFWTAANARIPLLTIVCNNRSFFNDEIHQERVARERSRPIENRWIGQRIGDPDPDLAMIARGQGLIGLGPVEQPSALPAVLAEAVALLKQGRAVVVDVRVTPGYSPSMTAGLTRSSE